MVCHCAWLFRRHRDGGRGISIFESPAGAVSADSSSTRLHICNERFRRLSTCSPHLVKAGAFDLPVRCELYELIRLVCNDVDCPLLHSHRQHRPAPAMDDPQLPVGNDVYGQPCIEHTYAKYTRWPTGLRSQALADQRAGRISAQHLSGVAGDFPAYERKRDRGPEQVSRGEIRAVELRSVMMNRRQFATATAVAFAPSALFRSNEERPRWEADGVGSLARIGVLTPDDDPVPESEMRTMAPVGVSIHVSRVLWNGDPRSLSFAEGADNAARLLTRLKPRLILYAFTASSYVLGEQDDDHLRTGIEQRAGGAKVLFTCPAAVEALRLMGARKVTLIHPPWFAEALNAKGKKYFEGRGFGVVSSTSLAPARTFQEVAPAELYEWTTAH